MTDSSPRATAEATAHEQRPLRAGASQAPEIEPGSFRDRNGRVFYGDGAVLRGLSPAAVENWNALSETSFYDRLLAEGKIVRTTRRQASNGVDPAWLEGWAAILEHERLPFISYPYEWSFGMLKDAALLQLDLLVSALEEDMILKDASAFNVQWRGSKPIFIDIPSFERLQQGEPWTGYRQFCQMFLYPLFLQAYKDIPFHPWLRGCIDGIGVEDCARLMSLRDLVRPGVFKHVYLQAKIQASYAKRTTDVRNELRTAGFDKKLIQANARNLIKLVESLSWRKSRSEWSHYAGEHSYADSDHNRKAEFVRQVVHSQAWPRVWDIGCNTGFFSRIAAENAESVIAMDADHLAVEHLYRALRRDGDTTIIPLVANLADPSPALGWRLLERKSLAERGKPHLTLCLALIHHMVISANIPLAEFVRWLADLGTDVVIEFVTRDDPMVQALLRNKDDQYSDYSTEHFEACLAHDFQVERREVLLSGSRILYFARNIRADG